MHFMFLKLGGFLSALWYLCIMVFVVLLKFVPLCQREELALVLTHTRALHLGRTQVFRMKVQVQRSQRSTCCTPTPKIPPQLTSVFFGGGQVAFVARSLCVRPLSSPANARTNILENVLWRVTARNCTSICYPCRIVSGLLRKGYCKASTWCAYICTSSSDASKTEKTRSSV